MSRASAWPTRCVLDLYSPATAQTYRVWVQVPATPAPAEGFPAVLLTDGNSSFASAADIAAMRALADLRPAVIIGVGYPDADPIEMLSLRNTELTPAGPLPSFLLPAEGREGGGADSFRAFLIEELRPEIASRWPVDAEDWTLHGHSLGGLFALYTLHRAPDAFRTITASSPSLWFNERFLLDEIDGLADALKTSQREVRVLVTVGSREDRMEAPDGYPSEARRAGDEGFRSCAMIDNARCYADRLARARPRGEIAFRLIADEGHISVIPAALSNALSFALGPRDLFFAS